MKMLKRLFRFSRNPFSANLWATSSKPRTETWLRSPVDPDEFTRLLTSGRTDDLKILARKLSGPARVKI